MLGSFLLLLGTAVYVTLFTLAMIKIADANIAAKERSQ